MQNKPLKYSLLLEILLRAAAWIAILSADLVGTAILSLAPANNGYFLGAITLSICFLFLIKRLGNDGVILDLQEICLYDVFVQIFGLTLFSTGISTKPYVALSAAIFIWKCVRIFWPASMNDGANFSNWPPFGLIRWISTAGINDQISKKDKAVVYFFSALTVPAGYLYTLPTKNVELILLHGLPLLIVLIFTKPIRELLVANEVARESAIEARISAEKEVEIANERLKDQQIIEAQNAELAIKNAELAASNRRLAQVNATLKNRNAELQALYEERDEMAQTLAARNDRLGDAIHDQKNNTIVMGFRAKELRESAVDENQRETATLLFDEIEDLARNLMAILHAAKLENHFPKPPGKQVIAAKSFCHYLFERLNPLALQYEVTLRCHYPQSDEPLAIETDEDIFKRIVINLLLNAIKYAGPNRDACITFYGGPDGCYVHVYDTGPGMAGLDGPDRVENFEILTERVAQAHVLRENQNTDPLHPTNGNGIGLLNVSRLCYDLGVIVKLRSKLGGGTDFCLKFPLAVPELPTDN